VNNLADKSKLRKRIGGYFTDRANEVYEAIRALQEQLYRNQNNSEDDKKTDTDTLAISKPAEREALYDKIQGMIDKGESLKSVSFEVFQRFSQDRYNMPITKNIYDVLYNASKTREDFDQNLRDVLDKWEKSGAGKWVNNIGKMNDVSYGTYGRNARVTFR
jgi:hypothetical protein